MVLTFFNKYLIVLRFCICSQSLLCFYGHVISAYVSDNDIL